MSNQNLIGGGTPCIPSEFNWQLINFCEFDKYAEKSYCAIHNVDKSLNLGDITKVDETKLNEFNMICGGSPCQDFSVAGKRKGSVWTCNDCEHEYNPLTVHWTEREKCPRCSSRNIDKTRSSLLVEYLRVVRANKPNFGMYENVKNIVGKQFKDTTFKLFTDELKEYGYNIYWKVLNAKDYGVPQNRERVYLIFVKKELDNGKFVFPEPFNNGIRLKDILEDEVDEKFYITSNKVDKFLQNMREEQKERFFKQALETFENKECNYGDTVDAFNKRVNKSGYSPTLTTRPEGFKTAILPVVENNSPRFLGNVNRPDFGTGYAGGVWDSNAISPTLTTMQGGNRQPHVITSLLSNKGEKFEKETEYANTLLARDYKGFGNQAMNGVIEAVELGNTTPSGKLQCNDVYPTEGVNTTLCDSVHGKFNTNLRIRKLTPKECFRLMGFSDENYKAAQSVVSKSQLYKQAGNSIVVDVLYYILVELYKAMPHLFDDLRLSSFFSGIGAFEIALNRLYEAINTGNFTQPQVRFVT